MIVFLLYLSELFFGYKYPKSKKVAFFSLFIMWILYSLNTYCGDYFGYQNMYESILRDLSSGNTFSFGEHEPGWSVLMLPCALLNLPFSAFRIFAGTIFVIILYISVKRLTPNFALALAVFSIFPFSHSFSVMRFGFAALIFAAFAIDYLKGDKSVKVKIMFLIGIILSASIHYSSIFLVVFILVSIKFKKSHIAVISIFTFVTFLLVKSDIPYNILMSIDLPHFSRLAELWFSHQSTPGRLSLAMFATGYICNSFVAITAWKKRPDSVFAKNVAKMYMLSVVFFPLIMVTDLFTRLYYALLIFNICSASDTLDVCMNHEEKVLDFRKIIMSPYITVLLAAILNFFLNDFVYIGTQHETFNNLEQNMLFNWLPF